MTLPCIAAARHFHFASHVPLVIGAQRFGWIRRRDAEHLLRWPEVFECSSLAVRIHPRFDHCAARTEALAPVVQALAAEGVITGWRDEQYAVRNAFADAPMAWIERAAARFFGTNTYAVHVNAYVPGRHAGVAPQLWIARRSVLKATDPGQLDNAVGGGIGNGYGVLETLAKECWEEAGLPPWMSRQARYGNTLHVLAEIPEGVQAEQIFIYDLALPAGCVPRNQDGEASGHWLAPVAQVMRAIERGHMTVDASLVSLDFLWRAGCITSADCEGLAALREPANE
ncbi:hypothetical protein PATSB16_34550 [Pandoraea thiooxydans]|uniref:NUDIX hydrolase n=1 Tax=Pandoraea thiooxydans TaxID=445709 RepID=A0A0G3EWQ4_9BURK|nr:DUF4743 domain-containing protein [Pandoraea thiooxydans]AKJ69196.1 DUF4743 domain-containing protein [Pandoraea thiooxydans]APR96791.1 hypothetical protein PATSB16_34550 [Pandoraea thiooxydans]